MPLIQARSAARSLWAMRGGVPAALAWRYAPKGGFVGFIFTWQRLNTSTPRRLSRPDGRYRRSVARMLATPRKA